MNTLHAKLNAAFQEKAGVFFDYVSRGFSVREAFDRTMGDGAYDRLVSELYDGLRA